MVIDCSKRENKDLHTCKKAVGEAHFTVIFPKADNNESRIDPNRFKRYVDAINDEFGGSTTKPITLGCWFDNDRGAMQCESGFAIETFRDFDEKDMQGNFKWKHLDAVQRKQKLNDDFRFLNALSSKAAREFGQDSIPVIFDGINDAKLNKGNWKQEISPDKLTGEKIPSDTLWDEHI